MSLMSSKYHTFIKKHSLDFNSILNKLQEDNLNLKNWCTQYDFINCELRDLLEDYPKFLNYTNLIDYTEKLYNQNKIITSTTMSVEQLNASIVDTTCHTLLSKINKITNNYDDLNKELTLQNNYVTRFSDLYNKNLFIYNYRINGYVTNYSGLLNDIHDYILNSYQISILNKHSFFHLYFLKSILNEYFIQKSTLNNNLLNNTSTIEIIPDFAAVIDNNQQILSDVIDVIFINQYNFSEVTQDFKDSIIQNTTITNKILDIKEILRTYLQSKQTIFKDKLIETFFDIFNHAYSFDYTINIFNQHSMFDFKGLNALAYNLYEVSELSEFENLQLQPTDYATTLLEFEQQMIAYYQTALNDFYSLKQYFYLLYLNRTQFEKFINIIDLTASSYVFDNIKLNDIYYFNKFSHLKSLFIDWNTYIYFNSLQRHLLHNYTSGKQKSFLNRNTNLINFSIIYEIYSVIEDFIQTDEFSDYLKEVQLEIYKYLRTNGFIENNIDWCSCDVPLKVYFMAYLKLIVHDNEFIDESVILSYIQEQIDNSEYNLDTQENFNIFLSEFIDLNANKMFDFYQSFLTSLNSSVFARAIHDIYKL